MMKPLFAFSEHELKVIEKRVGHKITKRYRNVRTIAKRWLSKRKGDHPQPKALCLRDIASAMGIDLESKLPEGGVTKRLREVRDYSSSAIATSPKT